MLGTPLETFYFHVGLLYKKLEHQEKQSQSLQEQNHLLDKKFKDVTLRILNGDPLGDEIIFDNLGYVDLSPFAALKFYQKNFKRIQLLDVSHQSYNPPISLEHAIKIPLEQLLISTNLLQNQKSILVISEDGVRSILACTTLKQKGFYAISNVSGGYEYWDKIRTSF